MPEPKQVDKLFVAMKAFVVYEGKVLVLQESTKYVDGTNAGKWDVPGGRVNPGESFRDALLREVKEETGLDVEMGAPFMIGEWWPEVRGEQWQIIATFSICDAKSADVKLGEDHAAFVWVEPKDYKNFNGTFSTAIPAAFEAYLKSVNSH
jgi:8-oxo-dGTP diphosphatase